VADGWVIGTTAAAAASALAAALAAVASWRSATRTAQLVSLESERRNDERADRVAIVAASQRATLLVRVHARIVRA